LIIAEKNADKLLAKTRTTFINKKASEVDIWEAELTWIDIQKQYYQTEYDLRKSYIELLYIFGYL
jgi:hypothetical protein